MTGGSAQTLDALLSGDAQAWASLVDRFTPRLRNVVRSYRLPAFTADDIIQTVWLRLLARGDRIREPGALGAWLETIARRECLRELHAASREQPTDAGEFEPEAVPAVDEHDLIARETREAVRRALAALPERQRRLLTALFADDAPEYVAISSELEMPIGSIGPTRARGLERLRQDAALLAAVDDRQ